VRYPNDPTADRNVCNIFYSWNGLGKRLTPQELRERTIELLAKVYDDDNLICDDREIEAVEKFARTIHNEAFSEVIDYLTNYRKAYDETLCPPRKLEEFDPMLRTVVAFHMGRFLLDNQIKDVSAMKVPHGQ
jgi:hypothetical protein